MKLDTVRALCHDLRQPLAVTPFLAGGPEGDVHHRLDGIVDQPQWLLDMVEAVIGGAADDRLDVVDVGDLAAHCLTLAQPTAQCEIGLIGIDRAMAVVAPIALSRAVTCVLGSAVQAAGPGGASDLRPGPAGGVVPGPAGGVVGRIVLPAAPASRSTTS